MLTSLEREDISASSEACNGGDESMRVAGGKIEADREKLSVAVE
jgi:hypothetical protein